MKMLNRLSWWICLATLVALGSQALGQENDFMRYEEKKPPLIWSADLPEGTFEVGHALTATLHFYFYEMPECGQWDRVWQARVSVTGPDGYKKFVSELVPISVGKRETYEATMRFDREGSYQVDAWIMAGTAPEDWSESYRRGTMFLYRTGKKISAFKLVSDSQQETFSEDHHSGSVQIKRLSQEEMQWSNAPGMKRSLSRRAESVESNHLPTDSTRTGEYCRYTILPYEVEPLSNVVLGSLATRPNGLYVLEFDGIAQIDSFHLSDSRLGDFVLLNNNVLRLNASKDRVEALLDIYFGDRCTHLFFNQNRSSCDGCRTCVLFGGSLRKEVCAKRNRSMDLQF